MDIRSATRHLPTGQQHVTACHEKARCGCQHFRPAIEDSHTCAMGPKVTPSRRIRTKGASQHLHRAHFNEVP